MGPFPRQLVWNMQNRFMSVWLKRSCEAGGVRGGGWSETWGHLKYTGKMINGN